MLELLTVLGIYFAISFVGMAALWTVAARKGVVPAPKFFFWFRTDQRSTLATINEVGATANTYQNFGPLGFTATAVLLCAISIQQPTAPSGLGARTNPNQTGSSKTLSSAA